MEVGIQTLEVLREEASILLPGCDNIGTAHRTQGQVVEVGEPQNCDGEWLAEGDDLGVDM